MIEIVKKDGTIEKMDLDEFSKWMCLVEALFFIKEKSEELNVDYSKLIKPLAIEEYIKERFHAMRYDVEREYNLGNI